MRSVVAVLIVLAVLSLPSTGTTDTSAFTSTYFKAINADSSALRTFSENIIRTPDLSLLSRGQVTAEINGIGVSEISQNALCSAGKYEYYSGFASLSSSVSGTGVQQVYSGMSFEGLTVLTNPSDDYSAQTNVMAKIFGLGMGSLKTDSIKDCKTIFFMESGHTTEASALFWPVIEKEQKPQNHYSVTFEPYAVELEQPADYFGRDVNLQFGLSDSGIEFYGYDFYQEIEIGGTSCMSGMRYLRDV